MASDPFNQSTRRTAMARFEVSDCNSSDSEDCDIEMTEVTPPSRSPAKPPRTKPPRTKPPRTKPSRTRQSPAKPSPKEQSPKQKSPAKQPPKKQKVDPQHTKNPEGDLVVKLEGLSSDHGGVRANMLDGDSREAPNGEMWWADFPPYFTFGETAWAQQFESDKTTEDLARGAREMAGLPEPEADVPSPTGFVRKSFSRLFGEKKARPPVPTPAPGRSYTIDKYLEDWKIGGEEMYEKVYHIISQRASSTKSGKRRSSTPSDGNYPPDPKRRRVIRPGVVRRSY